MRVDFGLWSVLASLQAENDWVAIHEEIWGKRDAATPLGELERARCSGDVAIG